MRAASGGEGHTIVVAGAGLGVVEQPLSKIPNPNIQAPDKHQIPISKALVAKRIGVWWLELLWSLEVDAWSFHSGSLPMRKTLCWGFLFTANYQNTRL